MKRKFRDFDAMMAQQKKDTMTLRVFGKDYTYPASIPAIIPLELSKYEGEDGVPGELVIKFLNTMFGEAAIAEWTSHREMTFDILGEMLRAAIAMATGTDTGEDEPVEVTEDDVPTNSGKN